MLSELALIGRRRKALGLTQSKLASLARVSQSFIAKVEQGSLDPAYSKIKRVFEVLERLEHAEKIKVASVMNRKIVGVSSGDKVAKAIAIMKRKEISQLPVLKGQTIVGSLSERTIVHLVERGESVGELSRKLVRAIMEEAFPSVPEDTPLALVSELLAHGNPAVLITKGGKPVGIVSKADILKAVR